MKTGLCMMGTLVVNDEVVVSVFKKVVIVNIAIHCPYVWDIKRVSDGG